MSTFVVQACVVGLLLTLGILAVVVRLLRDRPSSRTSARDRLCDRNPALAAASLRWSVDARRVRLDRPTVLVVTVALWLAVVRPVASTSVPDAS